MKTISCIVGVKGNDWTTTTSADPVAIPFKSGEGTLQITSVNIRCCVKPRGKRLISDTSDKKALHHARAKVTRRRVVTVILHVQGPDGGEERAFCVASMPIHEYDGPVTSSSSGAVGAATKPLPGAVDANMSVVANGSKLDLRFQMETVRVSTIIQGCGNWSHVEDEYDVRVGVIGTVSEMA